MWRVSSKGLENQEPRAGLADGESIFREGRGSIGWRLEGLAALNAACIQPLLCYSFSPSNHVWDGGYWSAMLFPALSAFICLLHVSQASVTVYTIGHTTATAQSASYTGSAAYDSTILNAPPIPNPAPPTEFSLQLQSSSQAVQGLSIMQSGSFLGFSIETSVINQVRECVQ